MGYDSSAVFTMQAALVAPRETNGDPRDAESLALCAAPADERAPNESSARSARSSSRARTAPSHPSRGRAVIAPWRD
jgi:hypothetical protein